VVIVGAAALATAIVRAVAEATCVALATETVNADVPDAVGVPEIAPVDVSISSPAGRPPPLIVQEYGVVPPDAASLVE
jgi:hypothetical protein